MERLETLLHGRKFSFESGVLTIYQGAHRLDVNLTDEDLSFSDDVLRERIIEPAIRVLDDAANPQNGMDAIRKARAAMEAALSNG